MTGDGMFAEIVTPEEFEQDTVVINEWDLWALLLRCGWPWGDESRSQQSRKGRRR
jgi:hypothetical protein